MARRVAGSKINWGAILERVPENQRPQFAAFKSRSDGYLRRVLANPETPPKIDWALYKKSISASIVDSFQKGYEGVKIDFPTENVSTQIDAQAKEIEAELQVLAKSTADIAAQFKAEIAHLESLVPYSEMTLEEFYVAHPEKAIDTFKNPTYWPHGDAERGIVREDNVEAHK